MTIEESIHVAFDETNSIRPTKDILDDITDTLEDTHIHEEVHKTKKKELAKILNPKKIKKKCGSSKGVENIKVSPS